MNSVVFIVIAILTLAAALAAATLPKLVHAALSFALSFVGVALFYFLLGAEFVGLVQVFVYVGAVAVLIVFTILLTRRGAEEEHGFHWSGALIGLAVFAGLTWAILRSTGLAASTSNTSSQEAKDFKVVVAMDAPPGASGAEVPDALGATEERDASASQTFVGGRAE